MPENNLNNLDEQLRQKFENFGSDPSDKVWENIAAGIAQENRRKRPFWLWFSLGALLVMLSGAAAWLLLKDSPDGPMQATSKQAATRPASEERTAVSGTNAGKNTTKTLAFEKADAANHSDKAANPAATAGKANEGSQKLAHNSRSANNVETNSEAFRTSKASEATKTNKSVTKKTQSYKKPQNQPVANNNIASANRHANQNASPANRSLAKADNRSATTRVKPTSPKSTNTQPANVSQGTKTAETTWAEPAIAVNTPASAADEMAVAKPNTQTSNKADKKEITDKKEVVASGSATGTTISEEAITSLPVAKPAKKADEVVAVETRNEAAKKEVTATATELAKTEEAPANTTQPVKDQDINNQNINRNSAATPSAAIASDASKNNSETPADNKVAATGEQTMAANTPAKPEKEYLDEENGVWAQDTTGKTSSPPANPDEIKPPNAIPVRYVDVFGSPEYSFRSLSGGQNPALVNTRNQYESAGLGFSGGVNMTFGLTKKLGVKTGLQYTELREKLDYPAAVLNDQAAFSSYKYVTMPLHLIYEKRGYSNFSVDFSAGPNVNLFVGGQSIILNDDGSYELKKWSDSGHIFKPYTLSATAAIGFNYRISKVVSLMVRPNVTYFPWSVTDDNQPEQKPYSVGAQTGIKFGF